MSDEKSELHLLPCTSTFGQKLIIDNNLLLITFFNFFWCQKDILCTASYSMKMINTNLHIQYKRKESGKSKFNHKIQGFKYDTVIIVNVVWYPSLDACQLVN